jgi:2-polyprenyl-6-methoxyphenol hydroxylase-like FAD-dependent oxidoreductase
VLSRPPENGRSGALLPLEGGRWIVTLAAAGGARPPADDAGFLAFAAGLDDPVIHDAIAGAVPISPIVPYRGTRNRLHHYEEVDRWPEGLVVLGDAACAFNPVYGQGMAAAALAALALDRRLREGGPGLARRFQRDLARVNARFWMMATSEDLRHPHTSGAGRGARVRLVHWYTDRLLRLAPSDRAVCLRLAAVANMVSPPTALLAPPVLRALAVAGCRRAAARLTGAAARLTRRRA